MKYQLVLQFPEKIISFDDLIQIEDEIIAQLTDGKLDGHDVGSGEINYFILTDNPESTFPSLKQYLKDREWLNCVKVAYRDLDGEDYKILYPDTLKEFVVQ